MMEGVHHPSSRSWICQDKVHVGSFIQSCIEADIVKEVVRGLFPIRDIAKQVATEAGSSGNQILNDLAKNCDANLLQCEGDDKLLTAKTWKELDKSGIRNESIQLESVKMLLPKVDMYAQATGKMRKSTINPSTYFDEQLRQSAFNDTMLKKDLRKKSSENNQPVAILSIQLFAPVNPRDARLQGFSCSSTGKGSSNYYLPIDMELEVTSDNTILDLRRFISCPSDFSLVADTPDESNQASTSSASSEPPGTVFSGDVWKSGFFFINDTFYNDLQDPAQVDHSEVIRSWASSGSRGIGPFNVSNMKETYFRDITIQLGYPYVYVHQGNCEHLFVFKDIRISDLETGEKQYPFITWMPRRYPLKCGLCKINTASLFVEEDDSLPVSPFFFCSDCHFIFYEKNNVIDLKAQTYVDKSALN